MSIRFYADNGKRIYDIHARLTSLISPEFVVDEINEEKNSFIIYNKIQYETTNVKDGVYIHCPRIRTNAYALINSYHDMVIYSDSSLGENHDNKFKTLEDVVRWMEWIHSTYVTHVNNNITTDVNCIYIY